MAGRRVYEMGVRHDGGPQIHPSMLQSRGSQAFKLVKDNYDADCEHGERNNIISNSLVFFLAVVYLSDAWLWVGSEATGFDKVNYAYFRIFFYIIILIWIPERWHTITLSARSNIIFSFFLLLSFLSLLWAFSIGSLLLTVDFLLIGFIALYISSSENIRTTFLSSYVRGSFLIIVASVATAIVIPDIGVATGLFEGLWRGLFSHKNALGFFSAFSFIVLLLCHKTVKLGILFKGLYAFLALFCVYMAGSATSSLIVVIAGALFTSILLLSFAKSSIRLISMIILIPLVLVVAGTNFEYVFEVFGRDSTLTGRTRIWQFFISLGQNNIYLGQGVGWSGLEPSIRMLAENYVSFPTISPHNSFIEVFLSLGLVGVVVFSLLMILTIARNFLLVAISANPGTAAGLVLPVVVFCYAIVESYRFGTSAGIVWLFLVGLCGRKTYRGLPREAASKGIDGNPPRFNGVQR